MKSTICFQNGIARAVRAICFAVCTAMAALPAQAADALTPTELAAVENQIKNAISLYHALNEKLSCLSAEDNAMEGQSNQMELAAADLRARRAQLIPIIKALQAQQASNEYELQSTQAAINDTVRTIQQLNESLRGAQDAKRICDAAAFVVFIARPACDLAFEISGLNAQINKQTGHRAFLANRVQTLSQHVASSQQQLAITTNDLASAEQAIDEQNERIRRLDEYIGQIKASLEALRRTRQDYALALSALTQAHTDLEQLDPKSDSTFVVRAIRTASTTLDAALIDATNAMNAIDLKSPSGQPICAG